MTTWKDPSADRMDMPTADHTATPSEAATPDGAGATDGFALRAPGQTHPTLAEAFAALAGARISTQQVDLLSVTGRLDDTGLTQLHRELQALFDTGTRYLVLDLARVTSCDYRLFDVLARTRQSLAARQGWMRLVGVSLAIRNALDEATPSEALLVDHASDWTSDLTDTDASTSGDGPRPHLPRTRRRT